MTILLENLRNDPMYWVVNPDPVTTVMIKVKPSEIKDFVKLNKGFTIFKSLHYATCYYMAKKGVFFGYETDDKNLSFFFAKIKQRFNLED